MFDEFKVSRAKRSINTRHEESSLTSRAKCFVSGGNDSSGSTQSSSTAYNTNIPEYAQPYVTSMLNATQQQLFNVQDGQVKGFAPYVPYSAKPEDYVAGFSPMQQQAFTGAANLQTPGQFGYGSDLASAAGAGALGSVTPAMTYGNTGAGYGAMGANIGQGALGYGASAAEAGQRGELIAQQYAAQAAAQGNRYGAAAANLAPQAQAYGRQAAGFGQTAADIGLMGLQAQAYGMDVGEQARNYAAQSAAAGQQYAQQATSPGAVQAYMSPYQQAATDVQKREAQRAFDIQTQARKGTAARAGAYGGARQAIEQAEAERNLNTQLQNIQATGDQAAYDRAMQSMQFGSTTGLQGLQGAQAGLGTALQGGQLGLSGIGQAISGQQAGIQGAQAGTSALGQAGNLYGLGMQGAGMGIQSGQLALAGAGQNIQGQQAGMQGIQGALAGTAQGMQGAQVGLQGVQGAQAGYGLANQAAGTMGQLGTQQLAAQQGIIGLQNQFGAQQQQRQQQIINQAVQDYANAQQYPLMQLGTMSNMLRGLPLQSSTTQQYIAQPNATTQAISTLGTAGSLYKAMGSKKGGIIDAKKMAKGGIASYDVGGAIEADLYDMPVERLQKELQSPSAEVRKMARRVMAEKSVEGKAGGGIIAFAGGTPDPEIIPQETATDTQYQAPQGIVAAPAQAPAPAPAPQRAAPMMSGDDIRGALVSGYNRSQTEYNRPIEERLAEREKMYAPDTARQEYRSKIMEERANARDEDTRQNWLRAAQFFANWGSRPGNTLAAGMTALRDIIPDVMSDQKEAKKYKREIDKIIYGLDEAARLEKNGRVDKAFEEREKLGERGLKYLGPLSTMYSADVHAAATRAAAAASSGRETDMKARYNVKLEELTNGDPSKATPAQKAAAMEWASNITLPGQKLDYKRVEDANKAVTDSEKNGTINNLEKSRRLALVQAGTPEEKKAVNEDYDRRIADTKAEIFNRYARGEGQQAAPAPATAAPAPASYTKDSVTVGSKTYTRPENFTDAQWKAYKDSVGAK